MSLAFVGYHGTSSANNVATTNAVGDLLIVRAYRTGSGTAPSLPASGWNDLGTVAATGGAGSTQTASRAGWRIATGTNEGSGTWTNANGVEVIVLSGHDATTPIGNVASAAENATRAYIRYPAVNRTKAGNWFVAFGSRLSAGGNASVATSPNDGTTTITNRGSTPATPYLSAHAALAQGNWSQTDVSIGGTAYKYNGWVIEVEEAVAAQTRQGEAAYSGAGTLASTAVRILTAAVAFAASATYTNDGAAVGGGSTVQAEVAYTGAGTASSTATLIRTASMASTGAGTLASASNLVRTASATYTSAGTLASTSTQVRATTATYSASGTASGTASVLRVAQSASTGAGTASYTGTTLRTASAAYAASGAFTGASNILRAASGAYTGSGTAASTGVTIRVQTASATGTGTFSSTADVVPGGTISASSAQTGTGTFAATGSTVRTQSAAFTASGLAEAAGATRRQQEAAFTATGTAGLTGATVRQQEAAWSATGTVSATPLTYAATFAAAPQQSATADGRPRYTATATVEAL